MKNNILQKVLLVILLIFFSVISNGQYAVFYAIWIFTTMLLFAVRKLPRWQGFLLAFLVTGIVYYIGFDVVPFLPISISIIIAIIFSLLTSLPYLIDSFFSKNRKSFQSTLIFPCAFVLIEYAYHQFNQYGSWGHFAYTQQTQHILLQSISVFGMGYITFLIAWFASVSNWVYDQRYEGRNVKKGVLIYGLVLGLTLMYGAYRVQFQNSNSETIRIASISALDSLKVGIDLQGINNKETENEAIIETKRNTSKLNQYLFDISIKEAEAGAKIVFWAEGNGVILKEDESELYDQAREIAYTQNIYLGLGIAVIDPANSRFLENKFVLFDRNGKKVMDYWKGISVPGAEAPISNNKTTGIQKIETDYGTIAGAICFDLDFPNYLKEAKGSDILLAPSNDYKEIDQLHTNMAKFRAIEQGFNLIRQASLGHSIGTDYTGKVISEMNHFTDTSKVLITQLPTKGTKTIYAVIGDSFIVFCIFLLGLVIIVLKRKRIGRKAS
ncbi:nitrilase-related carbon-nitrogen hydrolase [Aquiflexum lacus]|uniref:nitrilase-related carbon-nitrogen hydrolase n=1 Tax=Aquiflexum lacus TaxID=2483805 RepID=UPI0018930B9C|nr:nitrilase-related carbon-nitrogen hydrolase [Aquiflexum lacus]